MKTNYIFESHDELLAWMDRLLKQSYFRVTQNARHQTLYIDFPKMLVDSEYTGLAVPFPSDLPQVEGEITLVEFGNQHAKTLDETAN